MSRILVYRLACFAFVAAPTLSLAQRTRPDPRADEAAIRATLAKAVEAHRTGNADLWLQTATNDVVLMLNGDSAMKGKAQVGEYVRKFFATTTSDLQPRIVDVQISGDVGIVRTEDSGTFTPKAGGAPIPLSMKELIVFRREGDGSWKGAFISVSNNSATNVLQAGEPAATLVYRSADKAEYSAQQGTPIKFSQLFGDGDVDAPHGEFIVFPPGFDAGGVHVHTNTVNLVVLKGAYVYRDENGEKRVGPGEFIRIPGGHKHWSGGDEKEGAVFYSHLEKKMDQTAAK